MIIHLPKSGGGGGFNVHHHHANHKKTVALTSSSSYSSIRTSNLFQKSLLFIICMAEEKNKENCLVWM
jgi:hypothetical protein